MQPIVLDLFCGEGGAGKGYLDAGFSALGVDNDARALRRYPGGPWFDDWRDGLRTWAVNADLIHASPVCKRYSVATRNANRVSHPDQIAEVREALIATGKPYVIENVPGAPLRDPAELCGCMFWLSGWVNNCLLSIYRPRLFEASFPILVPAHNAHDGIALDAFGHGSKGAFYKRYGFGVPAADAKRIMGTPWMTRDGMSQSIPPAFAEFIGREFLASAALKAAA